MVEVVRNDDPRVVTTSVCIIMTHMAKQLGAQGQGLRFGSHETRVEFSQTTPLEH